MCDICFQFIVRESGKEPSLISALTVPALEALSVLLRQGEGLLSNPHHVTLALGAAQFVPLEHLSAQDYHAAFEAIHELLFAIVQCHTQVSTALHYWWLCLKTFENLKDRFGLCIATVFRELASA